MKRPSQSREAARQRREAIKRKRRERDASEAAEQARLARDREKRALRWKRWHRMHCEEGVPMRELARREDMHPSTILRGIRNWEDQLDDDGTPLSEKGLAPRPNAIRPRKKAPTQRKVRPQDVADPRWQDPVFRAEGLAMQQVGRLYSRGYLTVDHVAAARRFRRDPEAWKAALPPTMWKHLNALIVDEIAVEEMEDVNDWSARSAKVVLRVLLSMMIETPEPEPTMRSAEARELDEMRDQIEYLTGDDPDVYLPFMTEIGMTQQQARLVTILLRAQGQVVSRETLLRRLYWQRAVDEWPDEKIIDVLVSHIRKALEPTPYSVETVWGVGYRLTHGEAQEVPPPAPPEPVAKPVAQTAPKPAPRPVAPPRPTREPSVPPSMPGKREARAQIDYLRGEETDFYMPFVTEVGMTKTQARILTILLKAGGRPVRREHIMRKLYAGRTERETPLDRTVDTQVSKMRELLEKTPYRVEGAEGGFRLVTLENEFASEASRRSSAPRDDRSTGIPASGMPAS